MNETVILSAVRTPVGRYLGALKTVEAYDLAALVFTAVLARAHLASQNNVPIEIEIIRRRNGTQF